jgi:4a-hydroxytetrahydrobiopterin dehydratase
MTTLSDEIISKKLDQLTGWELVGQCIEKDFTFTDFPAAIVFMNRLVPTAEKLNHHPDWSNSYNKVHISLTSHDVKGLTNKDFEFAAAAEEAAANLG